MSYDNIAKQLKVSKPTLINWSNELQTELHNPCEIQKENLREHICYKQASHRLKMLSMQLRKAENELSKRDFSDVPTMQLLGIIMRLEARIAEEETDTTTFQLEHNGLAIFPNSGIKE